MDVISIKQDNFYVLDYKIGFLHVGCHKSNCIKKEKLRGKPQNCSSTRRRQIIERK